MYIAQDSVFEMNMLDTSRDVDSLVTQTVEDKTDATGTREEIPD